MANTTITDRLYARVWVMYLLARMISTDIHKVFQITIQTVWLRNVKWHIYMYKQHHYT